jgi:Pentapeptide repeats (8 copies)
VQQEETQQQEKKTRRGRAWDRTGFGGKTAWDWMELFIVPLVLALGAFLFNYSQNAQQQQMEETRAARQVAADELSAQEERLQTYLEEMGTLLVDKGLLDSEEDDETRYLARARTLAVLEQAGEGQKYTVVSFLAESGLADGRGGAGPVVSLANANLSGADLHVVDDMQGAVLTEADLSNTWVMQDLDGATLTRAQLDGADLPEAILRSAYLNAADLSNANLERADLREADLTDADLTGADLTGADLTGAEGITAEELEEQTSSLEGATMPDGTVHD